MPGVVEDDNLRLAILLVPPRFIDYELYRVSGLGGWGYPFSFGENAGDSKTVYLAEANSAHVTFRQEVGEIRRVLERFEEDQPKDKDECARPIAEFNQGLPFCTWVPTFNALRVMSSCLRPKNDIGKVTKMDATRIPQIQPWPQYPPKNPREIPVESTKARVAIIERTTSLSRARPRNCLAVAGSAEYSLSATRAGAPCDSMKANRLPMWTSRNHLYATGTNPRAIVTYAAIKGPMITVRNTAAACLGEAGGTSSAKLAAPLDHKLDSGLLDISVGELTAETAAVPMLPCMGGWLGLTRV